MAIRTSSAQTISLLRHHTVGFMLLILMLTVLLPINHANGSPNHQTVALEQNTTEINLAKHIAVFEDPDQDNDISRIQHEKSFRTNTQETPNFGYSHSDWWVRFHLKNNTHNQWYLLVDQPVGGDIELFALHEDTKSPITTQPLFERLDQHRTPAWKLNLPRNKAFTFYLRANNGQAILRMPIKILSADTFITHSSQQYMFFMLIFSGLLVLALYNITLFFRLKEISYLSLVLLITNMEMVFFRDSNLFSALSFLHRTDTWYYPLLLFSSLIIIFHYWRAINKDSNERLDITLKYIQLASLIMMPFAIIMPGILKFSCWFIVIITPFLLLMVTQTAIAGHRLTRSAYWAAVTFSISIVFYVLPHTGYTGWQSLPIASIYIGQTGFLLAMLLLSINQAERSQLLREQAESERAANKAKDEFLTTLSHELRTPLNVFINSGELLKNTPLSSTQQDYLEKQEKASHHLLQLVDELLDLSRMKSSSAQAVNKPFYLPEALREIHQMLHIQTEKKDVILRVEASDAPQAHLLGDRKALTQVLINLLGNAIKYTERGAVTLKVTPTDTKPNKQYIRLQFEVLDTGIGIAKEHQARLFQPFYQVDAGRTRQYGGFGLGLTISDKLVKKMGGNLKLHSIPGEGSCFYFTLEFPVQHITPLSNEANSIAANKPHHSPCPLQGIRVLLVDDDELNRFFGRKLLHSQGAEVVLAGSGQQAIMQLHQQVPDVVLMDVSMPGMNGYDTTRAIRSHARFQKLPVIALTAHAISGERERCMVAGMDDLITKPFKLKQLTETIIRYHSKQTTADKTEALLTST